MKKHFSPAQIVGAIGSAGTEAVAYKLLAPGTVQLVVSVAGIVVPAVLMVVDAVRHHAWAKVKVAEIGAEVDKLTALLEHHYAAPAKAKETAAAAIAQAKTT